MPRTFEINVVEVPSKQVRVGEAWVCSVPCGRLLLDVTILDLLMLFRIHGGRKNWGRLQGNVGNI
jgi:hypothetical protein